MIIPLLFLGSSCGKDGKKKSVPGPNDKVFTVGVSTVNQKDIPDSIEVTGIFVPLQTLEVKSDFSGKVQTLSVVEGQDILAGDVLLKIEDERLPWVLDRQRAELREAEAQMELDTQTGDAGGDEDALEELEEEEEGEEEGEGGEEEPEEEEQAEEEEEEEELEPGETPSPQQRLALLRRRAARARRMAAQRRNQRQRETQPARPVVNEEVSRSRQELNQARVERIRAEVAETEKQIQGSTLISPMDGFVNRVKISEGTLIQPTDFLMSIVTVDPIDLSVNVSKGKIGQVDKKTQVKVIVPDLKKSYPGEISFIGAELQPNQKSVEVRVRVENPGLKIKGGMEGVANMAVAGSSHKALLIPSDAVLEEDGKSYVYVVKGQLATKQEVVTGSHFEGQVEITKGIRKKDKVVSRGVELLKDPEEFIKVTSS